MLGVKNVTKSYDGKMILSNISFTVDEGEKAGIIGSNGIGKSTLLRIISNMEYADSGEISTGGALIGFLRQEFSLGEEKYSVEEFVKGYIGILNLERRLKELEETMGDDPELIQEYCDVQEDFINLDGYNFDYKLDTILNGLGLGEELATRSISTLSGGQKNKVMLSAVLLKGSNLLLLDEPTNNLDLKSIQWLENYLKSITTPTIIVSHDRRFLNSVTTKTLEVDFFTREMREYPGNYAEYKAFKEKEEEKQLERYSQQQETISSMRESITQKKEWANKGRKQGVKDKDKYTRGYERDRSSSLASNAKKIEKQIEQMDRVERPKIKEKLVIKIAPTKLKSSMELSVSKLVCGYQEGFRTDPITLEATFGDKIVIIGENGSGKSTFLKTLIGAQKPISGIISIGSGLNIGYMAQDTKEAENVSIEEYLKMAVDYENMENKSLIFTVMKQFNFEYAEKDKLYKLLSPGERVRAQLAKFSLQNVNALILDEPTNHLDIEALEALEEVLMSFAGTVISISHDREFISKINPNRVYKMDDGHLSEFDKNEIIK